MEEWNGSQSVSNDGSFNCDDKVGDSSTRADDHDLRDDGGRDDDEEEEDIILPLVLFVHRTNLPLLLLLVVVVQRFGYHN